jgi:hypothetical protein
MCFDAKHISQSDRCDNLTTPRGNVLTGASRFSLFRDYRDEDTIEASAQGACSVLTAAHRAIGKCRAIPLRVHLALDEWDGLRLKCPPGSKNGWIAEKSLPGTPEKERVAGIVSPATHIVGHAGPRFLKGHDSRRYWNRDDVHRVL